MTTVVVTEELAFIKHIDFGLGDIGRPVLWYTLDCLSGESLQVLTHFSEMADFLKDSNCYTIKDLIRQPCIVTVCDSKIRFKSWYH